MSPVVGLKKKLRVNGRGGNVGFESRCLNPVSQNKPNSNKLLTRSIEKNREKGG